MVYGVEGSFSRDTGFVVSGLSRFGGDLLSHVLRRSTIGATALNGRVRDGTGCFARAMATKPGNPLIDTIGPFGAVHVKLTRFGVCFLVQSFCYWIKSSLSGD